MAAFLICLLVLNLFCVPAFAQDTEIYTMVPEKHTITVSIDPGGAVIDEDGTLHTESYTAEIPHGGTLTLIMRPDSGHVLQSAKLDGQDVTISGGRLEISNITQDGRLEIAWKQASAVPSEKTYTIVGTVTENGKPAKGVTLELRSRLKTFVTGTDGKFRFDKVETGEHSLTALRDGKVVGYLFFVLKEGGEGVNVQKLPDGTYQLTVDGNVATVELVVSIQEDGTMTITKAEAISDKLAEKNYPPATGDDSMFGYWLVSMFAAGALVLLLTYRKRKGIRE